MAQPGSTRNRDEQTVEIVYALIPPAFCVGLLAAFLAFLRAAFHPGPGLTAFGVGILLGASIVGVVWTGRSLVRFGRAEGQPHNNRASTQSSS